MRPLAPALGLAAILVLSGCLEAPGTTLDTSRVAAPAALLTVNGAAFDAVQGHTWTLGSGGLRLAFDLELPDDFWSDKVGGLEASVMWNHTAMHSSDGITLRAPGGAATRGWTGWYASVAKIENPKNGHYEVEIKNSGTGKDAEFDAIVQVDAQPRYTGPTRDLLPDLVTIPPSDLRIAYPTYGFPLMPTGGRVAPGCGVDELVEGRATRCLRVSNGIGNIGEGSLEVRMSTQAAALSPAGLGDWTQRIHTSDGKSRHVPVGKAIFHATHAHFHYTGLAKLQVFKYDLERGERGDAVNSGRKNGFCFFDIGLVKLGLPHTASRGFTGAGCLMPSQDTREWYMGISPNWYDFYTWSLPDQYVDITGAPDGVYELVSTADAQGSLKESDKTNNEASAVFELKGDAVKILWATSQAT